LDDLNKNREIIKHLFEKYYKKRLEEEKYFIEEDIFDVYPEIPFFLKLKVYKSEESKFIPNSKRIKFKKFLSCQIEKENKNIEIKNEQKENMESNEESEEDSLIKIEINSNIKQKVNEAFSKSNKSKIKIKNNFNYEPLNMMNSSIINLGKEKFSNSKRNLLSKEKEKDSKDNNSNNNIVHSIMIIFNPNYLHKNINDDYNLININYNKIDLCDIFKPAHRIIENLEKISINKCFEEFTKVKILDEKNLDKCPNCEENIATRNKIELYKPPKILMIQLKRFEKGKKIKTFIDFPIKNLNISLFISNSSKYYSTYPIKYDLFAVSNHSGELENGHYNASCLNYINNHWYNFNDKNVEIIENDNPDSIVTKDAYVLFYRQRKIENINSAHIYNTQHQDIKDENYIENLSINDLKNKNNNLKNNFNIKSSMMDFDEKLDKKEINQISLFDEEINFDDFVNNPLSDSYLKLKRGRSKEKH